MHTPHKYFSQSVPSNEVQGPRGVTGVPRKRGRGPLLPCRRGLPINRYIYNARSITVGEGNAAVCVM